MKKVNKNMSLRPTSLVVGRHYYDNAINELGNQKCWPINHSDIYKSNSVKEQLNSIYYKKCAFCNQIPKGSPLQVEHFRPKNGVNNEVHPGYYWLGYEWTNLLYACGNCNSTKNTNFPLFAGVVRVPNPTWINANSFDLDQCLIYSEVLKNERYILINPEIDNPEKHLYYEPDGKISYRDIRGEISIDKYNLNRDELYLNGRKKIIDDIVRKIGKRFDKHIDGLIDKKNLFEQIVTVIEEDIIEQVELKESFDHFRYTIFKNFDLYIIPRFSIEKHRILLNIIFNKLNQGVSLKIN
jgi:uncharacterized protein (TIGR02646 family)